ncbi:hypothetical protein ACO0LI_30175 [Undibacterium sp. Tian12W]
MIKASIPLIANIPVVAVKEDISYPDRNTSQVYDHLKYTLSRPVPFPLPAIGVSLADEGIVVTRGHKYLRIARELGVTSIRAFLDAKKFASSDPLELLPEGSELVSGEELEDEGRIPVVRGFHVYFFDRPLNEVQQAEFISAVGSFFENLDTPLLQDSDKRLLSWGFPCEGRCVEFEANFPVGDRSWANDYLKVTLDFSKNVARILTFQGSLFFPELNA